MDEIQITPEMMAAGLRAYERWVPQDWAGDEMIADIYRAMERARLRTETARV
jgi:hypothetical protein